MSTYTIRPSLEVQFTKAPAIAIAGPSGCGKTESAMRLARGYCGPGEKFVVIDTEEKRALYKKARYQPWDWIDFQPPFTPERCKEVLEATKQYKAVVWDSGSHEYAGEGGLQDIQEDSLERMTKGDMSRADALSGPAWKDAKGRHKHVLMSYLIRYPTLLIICLRAEPKVKFVKIYDEKKKREVNTIVDMGFQPICEKMFMYEMLVGCKMAPDKAGVPEHIKQLEKELEPIFIEGRQIDESTGERLRAWAEDRATSYQPKAEAPQVVGNQGSVVTTDPPAPADASAPANAPPPLARIKSTLQYASKSLNNRMAGKLAASGIKSVDEIPDTKAPGILDWLTAAFEKETASFEKETMQQEGAQ